MKSALKQKEVKFYNQFGVKIPYVTGRGTNEDYAKQHKIASKWAVTDDQNEVSCGNVAMYTQFNRKTKKFSFSENGTSGDNDTILGFYQVMSPALMIYRLIAALKAQIKTVEDPYKCIWTASFKHKKSGKLIQFGEHKGGISFWLPEHSPKELEAGFKADLLELLNLIASDKCLHPYDGCVAGCVA